MPLVLLLAAGLGGLAWAYGATPLSDFDLGWHLATGREILRSGTWLRTDPFSHTHAGAPWPYKDAGAALLLWTLWDGLGPVALVALKIAAYALLAGAAVALARARGASWIAAGGLAAVLLMAAAFRVNERPGTFSLLAFAALLALLEAHRRGAPTRALWLAVPGVLLTAWLHRGVLLLPPVFVAYAVCAVRGTRVSRNLALAMSAAVTLAAFATPFGLDVLAPTFALLGGQAYRATIPEWQVSDARALWVASPASVLLGLGAFAAWVPHLRARRATGARVDLWDVVLTVLALVLPFGAVRFLPFAAVAALPLAAGAVARAGWRPRVTGLLAAAAFLAAFAGALRPELGAGLRTPLRARWYPEGALAFASRELAGGRLVGPVINEFGLGGGLIFALWPAAKVYVDGRNDQLYAPDFIATCTTLFTTADVLAREVERVGATWLFLQGPTASTARAHLDGDPTWSLVFVSERGLVYVRKDGPTAALAAARGYRRVHAHRLLPSLEEALRDVRAHAEVQADVQHLLEDDPDNVSAWLALALVQARLGAPEDERERVFEMLWRLGWRP